MIAEQWRRYQLGASLACVRPPTPIEGAAAESECILHVCRDLVSQGLPLELGRVALVAELRFARDVWATINEATHYYIRAWNAIRTGGLILVRLWCLSAALAREEKQARAVEKAIAALHLRRAETSRIARDIKENTHEFE